MKKAAVLFIFVVLPFSAFADGKQQVFNDEVDLVAPLTDDVSQAVDIIKAEGAKNASFAATATSETVTATTEIEVVDCEIRKCVPASAKKRLEKAVRESAKKPTRRAAKERVARVATKLKTSKMKISEMDKLLTELTTLSNALEKGVGNLSVITERLDAVEKRVDDELSKLNNRVSTLEKTGTRALTLGPMLSVTGVHSADGTSVLVGLVGARVALNWLPSLALYIDGGVGLMPGAKRPLATKVGLGILSLPAEERGLGYDIGVEGLFTGVHRLNTRQVFGLLRGGPVYKHDRLRLGVVANIGLEYDGSLVGGTVSAYGAGSYVSMDF